MKNGMMMVLHNQVKLIQNQYIDIMDNQFLSTPLLKDKKKIHSARDILQKDELIRGLEIKNNKLRNQIMKIQNVIDQSLRQEPDQKIKQRQSIMKSDQTHETMAKELANAYKKIKMYQYQINKIQQSQVEMGSIHKVKQVQSIIKEKKAMSDKLKTKLQEEQKQINENIKKLHNNSRQQEIEKKIKVLSDQVKFLRQKQKQHQGKDLIRQTNMKKQYEFIKRLENELLQTGMSPGEMEEIKTRAIKKIQTSVAESNVTKNTPIHRQDTQQDEIIEDRTIDNYKQIQAQIKLLEKMQIDYEKKMAEAEQEKDRAVRFNSQSRDRLVEVEDEIERLQKQVLVQKGKVIPSNLKPLRPLRALSSHLGSEKSKKIMSKNSSVLTKGVKSLAHLTKFDQVGMTSQKGQRFTDRNILGKKNLHTKIIGLTIYINNQTGAIGGLYAIYNTKKGGEYVKKDRQLKDQQYKEQKIMCGQGQYIKSITGTLTEQDKLQSLYVITNKGQSKRFSESKTTKKAFSFDIGPSEIPICIFGSLLVFKEVGKPEYSLVQHFGIQINEQGSGNSNELDYGDN